MKKVWTDFAWNDYCSFFDKHETKIIKRIHELLADIERNGYNKGIGQPEPLKHELVGFWSRRIDSKNRLVYAVEDESILIAQCGTHYHK